MSELSFDEEKHIYTLDGSIIPSVTTVMKPLSNSLYGGIDESVMKKAAERGTIVHNAIENYIKFGVTDCLHEFIPYFNAFLRWCRDYEVEFIESEQKTYHKFMRYAGTVDLVCKINGMRVLVDYKTSAAINRMLTGVQTEAYARAYETHGGRIDKKAILHLFGSGNYEFIEYKRNDIESWITFNALMTIYNHIRKYQGGKS